MSVMYIEREGHGSKTIWSGLAIPDFERKKPAVTVIVSDDPDIRSELSKTLKENGHDVAEVLDPDTSDQAIEERITEVVHAERSQIDLIVLAPSDEASDAVIDHADRLPAHTLLVAPPDIDEAHALVTGCDVVVKHDTDDQQRITAATNAVGVAAAHFYRLDRQIGSPPPPSLL